MGRKVLWVPSRVTAADIETAESLAPTNVGESASVKTVRNWFLFCRLNPGYSKPRLLSLFVAQQLRKQCKRSTIKGRLELVRYLPSSGDAAVEEATVDRMKSRALISLFGKEAQVDKVFKVNHALSTLRLPLLPAATHRRDQQYQSLWWALLTTGSRPVHLRQATLEAKEEGLAVRYGGGRKSEDNALARPLFYHFSWVAGPPTEQILRHLEGCRKIGTQNKKTKLWNTAACVNSWLKKWMARHHPLSDVCLSSTLPRVHLDNILRGRVHNGLMAASEFESLMDHTTKTSDEHYCSTLLT